MKQNFSLHNAHHSDLELMNFIKDVYVTSFPPEERREFSQLLALLQEETPFRVKVIRKGGEAIGFITYWNFDSYAYVEHFALHPEKRGGGAGAFTLQELGETLDMPIILEVEKPEDEMSVRRISFYERAGFRLWDNHLYIQPPYDPQKEELELLLMTQGDLNLDSDFEEVVAPIYKYVYKAEPKHYFAKLGR